MSIFKRLKNKVRSNSPLRIQCYYGYASPSSLFIKGRVFQDEGITKGRTDSAIKNLFENFKRFETDEVPGVPLSIEIEGQEYDVITDREGYFTLDVPWICEDRENSTWLQANVLCEGIESEIADVYYASKKAKYGIISDIDDTVLKTNVTSTFKLKMLYATFFKDAHQRLPMEGIVELFSKFTADDNPVFYISHSPWNIFDTLSDFMEIQGLPKGPILLRDFGIKPIGHYKSHKLASIRRILTKHPKLPFIMLGDTADEDADFYIDLANEFEDQVAAIYIRQTKDNKNAKRIKKLVEEYSHHKTDVILSESSEAMIAHATEKGFIA